jgi:hypothetical protein
MAAGRGSEVSRRKEYQALLAERDHPRADVFWNSEVARTLQLDAAGVLAPYDSPSAATLPASLRSPRGTWAGFGLRARVLVYHRGRVGEGERPRSLMDLTRPRFRGRAAIAEPLFGTTATHAGALRARLGAEGMETFFRALLENDVKVEEMKKASPLGCRGTTGFGLTFYEHVLTWPQTGLCDTPICITQEERDVMLPRRQCRGGVRGSFQLLGSICFLTSAFGKDSSSDLPVDLDGDGYSTVGDTSTLRQWLQAGGALEDALLHSIANGTVLDMSRFFLSGEAALADDAPIRPDAFVGEPLPAVAGAGGGCRTSASLDSAFQSGPVDTDGDGLPDTTPLQICDFLSDIAPSPVPFGTVDGLELDNIDNLYVTWKENAGQQNTNGGISRIDLPGLSAGQLPISPSRLTMIVNGIDLGLGFFTSIERAAWDLEANDLVVSFEEANRVERVDLDADPITSADITNVTTQVVMPEGIAILPMTDPNFGGEGTLFISESRDSARIWKIDESAGLTTPLGGDLNFLDNIQGLAFGGFPLPNQSGQEVPFSLFFSVKGGPNEGIFRLINALEPNWGLCLGTCLTPFNTADFADADPSTVLFDPMSRNLIVAEDRVAGRVQFAGTVSATPVVLDLDEPQGVVVHKFGALLIAEKNINSITIVTGFRYHFNRGDVNGDGRVNITDHNNLCRYLFGGSAPTPACFDAADINDDSRIDITDCSALGSFLYGGGGSPPAYPFFGTGLNAGCGPDPTFDLFDCGRFTSACQLLPSP